jgi:hypothetical protein
LPITRGAGRPRWTCSARPSIRFAGAWRIPVASDLAYSRSRVTARRVACRTRWVVTSIRRACSNRVARNPRDARSILHAKREPMSDATGAKRRRNW